MSPKLSHREKVRRVMEAFGHEDRVLIPIVADPDSIASALAVRRLLWRHVAGATISHLNEIKRQDNLSLIRLLKIKMIPFREIKPEHYTRLVLVDGQPNHAEKLSGLNFDLIIDHHPLVETTAAAIMDIRPTYGATATILTEYLRAAAITPSRSLATALFYAIKTDTDSFRRPSLEEDIKAFRFLYHYADQNLIRKIEYSEIPLKLLKFYSLALDRIKIRRETGFVYLGRVTTPDVLVMIADFLMHIQNIDTTVVAGRHEDKLIVIFRNARSRRSVGRVAEQAFGKLGPAGGHHAAARAEIPLAVLKDLVKDFEDETLDRFIIRTIKGRRR